MFNAAFLEVLVGFYVQKIVYPTQRAQTLEKFKGSFEKRLNIFKIYECAPMQIGKGN